MIPTASGDKPPENQNPSSKEISVPLTGRRTSRTALLAGIHAHNKRDAVEEALKREEAVRLIERAWYRHGQKAVTQKPPKRRKTRKRIPSSTRSSCKEHWLWKSLRSYSKEERMSAANLLLCSLDGTDLDYERQRRVPPLVRLFHRHVVMKHDAVPVQVALEWVSLLQCMLATDSRCFIPYWDWVTWAIWLCANRRDLTALCSLTNLVYQLSIRTMSFPNFANFTEGLTTFNQSMLWGDKRLKKIISDRKKESHNSVSEHVVQHISPLARLIGAHFCIAAEGSQLTLTPSACREASSMLAQLIDPAVAPAIVSSSAISNTEKVSEKAPEVVVKPPSPKRRRTFSLLEGYDSDFTHAAVPTAMDHTVDTAIDLDEGELYDEEEEDGDGNEHVKIQSENILDGGIHESAKDNRDTSFPYDDDEDDEEKDEESDNQEEGEEDEEDDEDDEEYGHVCQDEKIMVPVDSDDSEVEGTDDQDTGEHDIEIDDEDAMDEGTPSHGLSRIIDRSMRLHAAGKTTEVDEICSPAIVEVKEGVLTLSLDPPLAERQRMYIAACMEVLTAHYPPSQHSPGGSSRDPYLRLSSEQCLIKSINGIIKPPKKPLDIKVIMRRAPTQEEFFRGSLSQNPIPVSALKARSTQRSSETSDSIERTVGDLRQHIAEDLQMPDSAELIEILVADKILDTNLKLRVVHQVLWRQHLIEHPSAGIMSLLSSSNSFFSRGSGLSIFFSADRDEDDENRRPNAVTEETPVSELPSLLATYRLAGVDGEATEDTVGVNDIVDPDAPNNSTSLEEKDRQLQVEYGNTRLIADGKGVYVLLRSIQHTVLDAVRRVYRDDVGCNKANSSRLSLRQNPPCEALQLLRHCTKLQQNRKRLLQARAPTMLLTLLLEVLNALEGSTDSTSDASGSCPTAELLQELIESLTSDISIGSADTGDDFEVYLGFDGASMPLLLTSIEMMCLSAPLRRIIAKLLPFLTYGRPDLSRELAQQFDRHICLDKLADLEVNKAAENDSILTKTLVDTLINLPPNDICNSLRDELINCGFVENLVTFAMKEMPIYPPTWSASLWPEGEATLTALSENNLDQTIREGWRVLFGRLGVRSVFRILTGLCQRHVPTQSCIAVSRKFVQCCHWIEATSDSVADGIVTSGLGLLAETLLDDLGEGNDDVSGMIDSIRKETKLRKKMIALQRRKHTMLKLGIHSGGLAFEDTSRSSVAARAAGSVVASVQELFQNAASNLSTLGLSRRALKSKKEKRKHDVKDKPGWLTEAESMVEETGLRCVVCHEGRTLQPKEILGLYTFTKKVVLPLNKNMTRSSIDGTNLLKALPVIIPVNLIGDPFSEEWFARALESKLAVQILPAEVSQSAIRRSSTFVTTTSAGNAIHNSCHQRAKQADRNHPKAPKSEWEGASLRNSRVKCNSTFPLISSQHSSVPLVDVNSGLSEYQSAIGNVLGSPLPGMLWHVLHDIRFLLLRMAYGESLNIDSGGGSLASNCQLIFYQMHLAETFAKEADAELKEKSIHARGLSAGCLLACGIAFTKDSKVDNTELSRAAADSTLMGAVTSIIFHNTKPCGSGTPPLDNESEKPHPKREWLIGRELFLRGLLVCAGRRHVLNLNSSGCQSGRTLSGRKRTSSFVEWENVDEEKDTNSPNEGVASRAKRRRTSRSSARSNMTSVDDFQNAFRPMITLFAILDQVSAEFSQGMDDIQIELSSQRMVQVIENCQASRGIQELLQKAKVPLDNGQMISLLQRGMVLG